MLQHCTMELKRGKIAISNVCVWVVAQLPQRLKSTFFEKKFLHSKKFQKPLILAFEADNMASLNCTFFGF